MKNILYWFIEGHAHLGVAKARMSLILNEPK